MPVCAVVSQTLRVGSVVTLPASATWRWPTINSPSSSCWPAGRMLEASGARRGQLRPHPAPRGDQLRAGDHGGGQPPHHDADQAADAAALGQELRDTLRLPVARAMPCPLHDLLPAELHAATPGYKRRPAAPPSGPGRSPQAHL